MADITLNGADAAWLRVLVDAAVPREPDSPMDWEGDGRAHALALLAEGSTD